MDKIIYFDYCAFILLCILLFTTISRKMTHGRQNRRFICLMTVILTATVADICTVTLSRMGPGHIPAKYAAHIVFLMAHSASAPCYAVYLFTVIDIWHKFYKQPFLSALAFVPFICCAALLLLSPSNHLIFYIDDAGAYTRGPWFPVLYAVAAVYFILGMINLYRHWKQFTLIQLVTLSSIFILTIVSSVIQYFHPAYLVEMFSNSAALTLISMMIQRPENMLDSDTGLGKITAYVTNVRNAAITSKHMEIIMLNIANFNILHEILGYERMTYMIRTIADQLTELNQNQNTKAELYYLGQGKYRIVMDSCHFNRTEDVAEKICSMLHSSFILDLMKINIMAHVCIARYPEDISDVDALIAFGNDLNTIPYTGKIMHAADFYQKEYYDIQKDIDRIMEEALAENKFEVYFQPIYSVTEQRFNSAEALLRLKTEKYGFISPELFIPAAEKSGAIHKIGDFVIDEVCKFIASREYQDLGIDYIEVNLSVAQCMQNNLASDILDTLNRYSVSPDQINLEITETAASYSQKTMMENLQALKDAGISFSLDDFGTGYSNMRRIASLPLHIVKLDKSFTNIDENPKLLIVLKNTIRMIKDMNLKIVVEGIETENMVRQFAELECEYIQGYFYSKPLPKRDFVNFIKKAKDA